MQLRCRLPPSVHVWILWGTSGRHVRRFRHHLHFFLPDSIFNSIRSRGSIFEGWQLAVPLSLEEPYTDLIFGHFETASLCPRYLTLPPVLSPAVKNLNERTLSWVFAHINLSLLHGSEDSSHEHLTSPQTGDVVRQFFEEMMCKLSIQRWMREDLQRVRTEAEGRKITSGRRICIHKGPEVGRTVGLRNWNEELCGALHSGQGEWQKGKLEGRSLSRTFALQWTNHSY